MALYPFFSILCAMQAFAQQKEVTGIVFDKDKQARVLPG
jgi:hypothetical protein